MTRVNSRSAAGTVAVPAGKGEGTTRGAGLCLVHFDNRTPWYISTYVDGNPAGSMGPYGDVYYYAVAGATRLYARAPFDDGSALTWGPTVVTCPADGVFTWELKP